MQIKQMMVGLVLALTATISLAKNYQQGVDYQVVTGLPVKQGQVTEFFSFFCPACFRQEPMMKLIASNLPAGVSFNKSHVSGLPGRDREIELALSASYALANKHPQQDDIVAAIFNRIHIERKPFKTIDEIANLFANFNVDPAEFNKGFNSFAIRAQAKQMDKQNKILNAQGVSGVPAIIVNGKYKALLNNVKSEQDYQELVQYLLTLPL